MVAAAASVVVMSNPTSWFRVAGSAVTIVVSDVLVPREVYWYFVREFPNMGASLVRRSGLIEHNGHIGHRAVSYRSGSIDGNRRGRNDYAGHGHASSGCREVETTFAGLGLAVRTRGSNNGCGGRLVGVHALVV